MSEEELQLKGWDAYFVRMIKKCAYCKGTGKSPFSSLFRCPVCRGRGEVEVVEPVQKCPFCEGKGRLSLGICCKVCEGKGCITQPKGAIKCDRCEGSGKEFKKSFSLPGRTRCHKCKGYGFILAPEVSLPKVLPKKVPPVSRKKPVKKPPLKKPLVKRLPEKKPPIKKGPKVIEKKISLTDLTGVTPKIAEALKKANYKTAEDIATTSVAKLEKIEGLDLRKAARLLNDAREKLKKLGKEYLWEK